MKKGALKDVIVNELYNDEIELCANNMLTEPLNLLNVDEHNRILAKAWKLSI